MVGTRTFEGASDAVGILSGDETLRSCRRSSAYLLIVLLAWRVLVDYGLSRSSQCWGVQELSLERKVVEADAVL